MIVSKLIFPNVFYKKQILKNNSLYVGNFMNIKGKHQDTILKRQNFILSCSLVWYRVFRYHKHSYSSFKYECLLTPLYKKSPDMKNILNIFFNIEKTGYNFGDDVYDSSICTIKILNDNIVNDIENILDEIELKVESIDEEESKEESFKNVFSRKSHVKIQCDKKILSDVKKHNRYDLLPSVKWLLKEKEIDFYFIPSGKLQARETSVYPIKNIETWPSWLRSKLFGRVIDIENSYCQFLISSMLKIKKIKDIKKEYPHLYELNFNKTEYRRNLSKMIFNKTDEYSINIIKKIIMSLANGSNISEKILLSHNTNYAAADIILKFSDELDENKKYNIGSYLKELVNDFNKIKLDFCKNILKLDESPENLKLVFVEYFFWEKEQRNKIWENINKTGLMLHDGIDGIISDLSNKEIKDLIEQNLGIKVSVE